MPIPGLTDVYEFGDWLKKEYPKQKSALMIKSELGGLITVSEIPPENGKEGWDV